MVTADIISLTSAAIAFSSMSVSIFFSIKSSSASKKSITHADRANNISIGQTETILREQISNSRIRAEDCGNKIAEFTLSKSKLTKKDHQYIEFLKKSWKSAIENNLNAYEDACGKYLDSKTDKDRFKKSYLPEIRNLCDPKKQVYVELMHPESTSHYRSIWKVYKEWNHLE